MPKTVDPAYRGGVEAEFEVPGCGVYCVLAKMKEFWMLKTDQWPQTKHIDCPFRKDDFGGWWAGKNGNA